jgi:anti-sigma regulatory factor (Ser/Thr protein kinase)
MTDQFELTLLNRQPEIARVQGELERFANKHALARRPLHDVQLALEEHLTNIVNHAYEDEQEHRIKVRFLFNRPELQIEVEDDGRPFNPLEHPTPNLSLPLDQRPIGGLGIHMIRKSLDHVEYHREHDRNRLVMVKRT